MENDFKNKLIEWKEDILYKEDKSVKVEKIYDEYRIELKITVSVRVDNNSRCIEESVRFYTQAQSSTNSHMPTADMKMLDIFKNIITEKFYSAYSKTVDQLMLNAIPSGYLEL